MNGAVSPSSPPPYACRAFVVKTLPCLPRLFVNLLSLPVCIPTAQNSFSRTPTCIRTSQSFRPIPPVHVICQSHLTFLDLTSVTEKKTGCSRIEVNYCSST